MAFLGMFAVASVQAVAPVAIGGPPQLIAVTGTADSAVCRLDTSRSYDPDGTIASYAWWYRSTLYTNAPVVNVTLPLGVHAFWLVLRDNSGAYGTGLVVVSVCRGLLQETFETPALDTWQSGAGAWAVEDGTLVQTGAVADGFIGHAGAGATAWSNYTLSVTMQPATTGTVGCALYCRDASNYYAFAVQGATNLSFVCVTNGVALPLAAAMRAFSVTQAHTFAIAVTNGLFTVRSGLQNLFNRTITNTLVQHGSIGLLAREGARGAFSNIVVVQRPRAVRIVPVGDSITHGRGTLPYTYSWRYPLHRLCSEADFPVDFIGTFSTGFNGDPPWTNFHGWAFDRHHQATWGIRPEAVSNAFDGYLKTYAEPGDVILFLLGTNGAGETNATPSSIVRAAESHRRMIEIARRYKPHVLIILGEPFQEWAPFPEMRTAYRALAADMTRPWSPVLTVDHSRGWISNPASAGSHTVDWVHPNVTGDFRLASLWLWPLTHAAGHALATADAPQAPTLLINNGEATTYSTTVTVALAALNPTPDCMRVAESNSFGKALWETYTTSVTLVLSPALGIKTVAAQFNAGGPSSGVASDTIELVPEPAAVAGASVCGVLYAVFGGRHRHH